MAEKLLKPTPVRLHRATKDRLAKTAERFRMKPAELVRHAIDQKLAEWEKHGVLTISANAK